MESVVLNIKNMVCPRCIMVVKHELSALGINIDHVDLGHVVCQIPNTISLNDIDDKLNQLGFELIRDKELLLIEKIKILVIEYIILLEESSRMITLSDHMSTQLGKHYNYLSKVFSTKCHKTIEQYFIMQRLNRVKELLDYGELNVSEIAVKLRYSSVHYLSSQFKKVTGISISEYKENLKSLNSTYTDLSEALIDLKNNGYENEFEKRSDRYYCSSIREYFNETDLKIEEIFRYPIDNKKGNISKVSIVESNNGIKGLIVDIPENGMNYSRV